MKTPYIVIFSGLLAAAIAFGWQARVVTGLRSEVAGLRQDLRTVLEASLEKPAAAANSPEAEQRDKLELIKLRNEVRALKEGLVESHSRERGANVRTIVRSVLPAAPAVGEWKFRSEWKPFQTLATNQYTQAMQTLAGATDEYARFLALDRAAKMSLAVGHTEDARQFATDLLALDEKYRRGDAEKANGDAVHDGHLVLGLIAIDEERIEEAKRHLLAAAETKGSSQLATSGPNMSLAKELLEKGEPETVLQYLESCRRFWDFGSRKLYEWTKDVQAGRIPEFGANLLY
jgi:hypothetical protein